MLSPNQIEEQVRRHQGPLQWYLLYLGCPRGEVADLVQDTFLAFLGADFTATSPTATAAYLRKVARNLWFTHARQAARQPLFADGDAVERVWVEFDRDDGGDNWIDALRQCLATLSTEGRRVLSLRYGEAMSRREIAQTTGRSEGGVKILLERVKGALRDCIERKLS